MACFDKSVSFAVSLLFVGFSLHGCGRSSGHGGEGGVTTTIITTSTTTLSPFHVDSPCVVEGKISDCVDYLNEQYLGFDPNNDTSPVGVTIRGQPRFNEKGWLFCGTGCFKGQPDCYTAAAVINHMEMLTPGKTAAIYSGDPVGIVFQPTAIAQWITKCSWQFDGSAFTRTNGGCANNPGAANCSLPNTAYYDICPTTGKPIPDDYSCPTVTQTDCQTKEVDYPSTCYWKGAAFYSDARPNATLHPPNLTKGSDAGLRQMMKQRLQNQGNGDKKTNDGEHTLLEFNNEVTIDGKVLVAMLRVAPKAAIAAFSYNKGDKQAYDYAVQYNDQLEKNYGVKVPIVALDGNKVIGPGSGPFAHEDSEYVVL